MTSPKTPTPRQTNGVFVPNEVIYLEIQDLKVAVLKGMAQRPTWAALGKVLLGLTSITGLLFVVLG